MTNLDLVKDTSIPKSTLTKKEMELRDLFIQYQTDENLYIDSLPWDSENWQESERKLTQRIEAMEKIQYESKARATTLYAKKRAIKAKYGVGIWDKTPLNPDNLINDSKTAYEERRKQKIKTLSKIETLIKNQITLGYTDEEILDELGGNEKYKPIEVREAIEKMRGR